MRKTIDLHGAVKLWLSAHDTNQWANEYRAVWPGSFVANKPLFAEFAPNGDLVDLAIDYGRGDRDCPENEFRAIMNDFLAGVDP